MSAINNTIKNSNLPKLYSGKNIYLNKNKINLNVIAQILSLYFNF